MINIFLTLKEEEKWRTFTLAAAESVTRERLVTLIMKVDMRAFESFYCLPCKTYLGPIVSLAQ